MRTSGAFATWQILQIASEHSARHSARDFAQYLGYGFDDRPRDGAQARLAVNQDQPGCCDGSGEQARRPLPPPRPSRRFRVEKTAGLPTPERGVDALASQQLPVSAGFHDPAFFEHDQAVHRRDRR